VITVLLVDDHDLIRQGLRRAFESDPAFNVVGDAGTVEEALAKATALRPDVVVMDVRLPDGSGLDAARALRAERADIGIVVLTMYAGDEQMFAALEAGASAFINKDAPADEVIAAARHAATAPTAFSSRELAGAMIRRTEQSGPVLTPREREVLDLLTEGIPISALAKRLYVSESTAKTHISRLYEKLGAANRAQALMTAVRLGLVQGQDK
jgi:DNA-binding NarL/FixJ family response regulator